MNMVTFDITNRLDLFMGSLLIDVDGEEDDDS